MKSFRRTLLLAYVFVLAVFVSLAAATTPVVTVTSPKPGSQDSSPVNFAATASSPDCSAGINAMRIYPSPGDGAYTVDAASLDVNMNLIPGTYSAVVQAWDNCGGVGKTTVNITVTSKVTMPPPKFFYSTQYSSGKVAGYLVNPQSGALTATGQPPVWAHWGPTRIASDSGGYRLYVANQGSQDVSAYFINRSNGYLTPVPGANFPVGGVSTDIAVHPSNKFVYVTTSNNYDGVTAGGNGIAAFSVASNGSLVAVPGSPFLTSDENYALAIDPAGKFLYTTGAQSGANYPGEISVYSIDQSTGALAEIAGSPYTIVPYNCAGCFTVENFHDLAIDHTGNYLIGPGYLNGVVYSYSLDRSTGAITPVPGSPVVVQLPQGFPSPELDSVTVQATNKYVYLECELDSAMFTLQLDSSTGALTAVGTVAPPNNTYSLALDSVRADPSGSFVYALGWQQSQSQNNGKIFGYAIDQADGTLALVPGAPYADNGIVTSTGGVDGVAITP